MTHEFTINTLGGIFPMIVAFGILLIFAAILITVCHYVARNFLIKPISAIFSHSNFNVGSSLLKNGVVSRLAYLIPGILIYNYAYFLDINYDSYKIRLANFTESITTLYIIICIALLLAAILDCIHDRYKKLPISIHKPIKSYLEVIKITIYAIAVIFCVSYTTGKSPVYLFTGLGAVMAIISLVFKDSILGFIASIQLSANDMVRINDNIEMPEYGANGEVIEISLNTVKVQNFDNSIVTIPSYALLSSGMKNWRGMVESGGRRIKQFIPIDLTTIKYCDEDLFQRLSKIDVIKEKMHSSIKKESLTNLHIFCWYIENYLKRHPEINHRMSAIVRQQQSGPNGLPLEIYCFTRQTAFVDYEKVQTEIMLDLYAIMPIFDLKPFQAAH